MAWTSRLLPRSCCLAPASQRDVVLQVVKGMDDTVDKLYKGYGEGAPSGQGPEQGRVQSEGNRYLKRSFPNLSYIVSARKIAKDEL